MSVLCAMLCTAVHQLSVHACDQAKNGGQACEKVDHCCRKHLELLVAMFISAHQVGVKRKRGAQADDGKGGGSPKTPHLSAADFQK